MIDGKFKVYECAECLVCGTKLSPPKVFHGVPEESPETPDSAAQESDLPISRASDQSTEQVSYGALTYSYDPFSSDYDPSFEANLQSSPAASSLRSSNSNASELARNEIIANPDVTYVLELRGGPLVVELPRFTGEGIVGRSFAGADALASFATVSRRQFAYRYLPEGGLRITNLSRYGTSVNGRMLGRDELTGIPQSVNVIPPATLTMGGQDFDLVVDHD